MNFNNEKEKFQPFMTHYKDVGSSIHHTQKLYWHEFYFCSKIPFFHYIGILKSTPCARNCSTDGKLLIWWIIFMHTLRLQLEIKSYTNIQRNKESITMSKIVTGGVLIRMVLSPSSAVGIHIPTQCALTASHNWHKLPKDMVKWGWYTFLFCDIFNVAIKICRIKSTILASFRVNSTQPNKSLYRWDESPASCSRAYFCSHSLVFLDATTSLTT